MTKNKSNFIIKLFKGNISLPITYWVFSVLIGNVLFSVVSQIIEFNYVDIMMTKFGYWTLNILYLFAIAYSVFILIAIWRSAGKYKGKTIWADLARIMVVLNVIVLISIFLLESLEQKNNYDVSLKEEITLINKSLPTMIDDITRLDRVFIQGKDVHYSYTILNSLIEDIDITNLNSDMTEKIKIGVCNDKHTKLILDNNRNLIYSYQDEKGNLITTITISKGNCTLLESN